ncbi:CoA-transferase family III [Marasmius fiardii PR-910]|nr:CoA-transferase family III [Marasmius fiardii PR-910]
MSSNYSVTAEAAKLLEEGLIQNKLHQSAPPEIQDVYKLVEFEGSDLPVIPINWRFAESIAAIKGYQASMLNVLLKRKFGIEPQKVVINTDHAQLFFMSPMISSIVSEGKDILPANRAEFNRWFPPVFTDPQRYPDPYTPCTNIYKTKDGKFYHVHASLNATPSQTALGIPREYDLKPGETEYTIYEHKVAQFDSVSLDKTINDQYRQAGTICQTVDEYLSSEHGKANTHVGLYELHHVPNTSQKPDWWTSPGGVDPSRPLFGLKIVDLSRIIAAPTIGRELAELGASILRVTSPNVNDIQSLNFDLGWGKWSAHLDLSKEEDRAKLKGLIAEADVVIDGYRPGVMQKWGFDKEDIFKMISQRDRGIIYVHENCYGWNGPLSYRSGWQQISDAHCGVSIEYGRAMGHGEAVTPVFPNSDFCTGAAGAIGVLQALIERADKGGSYAVDVALNYYSQWLVRSCLTYPPKVWEKLWSLHGNPVFRHIDNMGVTIPAMLQLLKKNSPGLFDPSFFELRENGALGVKVKTIKPVLQFPEGKVKPRFNVGSRPNGTDEAKWPQDLMTEVIA